MVVVVAGAWVVVVVAGAGVVVVVAGARVVVVVAGADIVVVVAAGAALVVVVVARAWVVVVVAGARLVVVVVAGLVVVVVAGLVVVVVAGASEVLGVVAVPARCCQVRWLRGVAPEVLVRLKDLFLALEGPPRAKELTVAPEVLLAARELPSTASATATTIPPARVRRRLTGEVP